MHDKIYINIFYLVNNESDKWKGFKMLLKHFDIFMPIVQHTKNKELFDIWAFKPTEIKGLYFVYVMWTESVSRLGKFDWIVNKYNSLVQVTPISSLQNSCSTYFFCYSVNTCLGQDVCFQIVFAGWLSQGIAYRTTLVAPLIGLQMKKHHIVFCVNFSLSNQIASSFFFITFQYTIA